MMPGHWVEEMRGEMLLLPRPHIPWGYSLNPPWEGFLEGEKWEGVDKPEGTWRL